MPRHIWRGTTAAVAAAALLATIVLANYLVDRYGAVPVGFGLLAPAAVYVAGLAFTLRDVLHETGGRWAVLAVIACGALLSAALSDGRIALASGVAFGVSELADLLVYEPLRRRTWVGAVAVSGAVGLTVDSLLFLSIAFGSLTYLPGQFVGKAWVLVATVLLVLPARNRLAPRTT